MGLAAPLAMVGDELATSLASSAASGERGLGNVAGGSATSGEILDGAIKWLGEKYREIKNGIFRSADDARQFRMTTSDLNDARQGAHVHFESIGADGKKIVENSHVKVKDP